MRLLALVVLTLAACARPEGAAAPRAQALRECSCRSPPGVERPSLDGGTNLSGGWERIGFENAPPGPVVRCAEGYRAIAEGQFSERTWVVRQTATRVQLWAHAVTITRDRNVRTVARSCEEARGALDGGAFVLTGVECTEWGRPTAIYEGVPARPLAPPRAGTPNPVAYELRLEAGTGHLIGTRNGAQIRFAPVEWVKTGAPCSQPR